MDVAVNAIRSGAADFLNKPFALSASTRRSRELNTVASMIPPGVSKANRCRLRSGAKNSLQNPWRAPLFARCLQCHRAYLRHGLLGDDHWRKRHGQRAHRPRSTQSSERRGKPFVTVNCAAIPENLLESELFGHVKGAFTGATNNREGRFTAANGGTIFLDEIGEMPMALQAKLLRVLQEKEVTPVGETRTHKVDIRILSATNIDLDDAIENKVFREDLLYRLNVIPSSFLRYESVPRISQLWSLTLSTAAMSDADVQLSPSTQASCRGCSPTSGQEISDSSKTLWNEWLFSRPRVAYAR